MLSVTGQLSSRALDTYLDDAEGVIDLAGTSFVEPCGLVTVAALAERATRQGVDLEFRAPTNFGVKNYMSRMGLGEILEKLGVDNSLPKVRAADLGDTLLELQPFSSESDGERLARLVYGKVKDDLHADAAIASALYDALIELTGNVTFHAEVENGFLAAQTFKRQDGTERIAFAIGDGGIGVKTSLTRNPKYSAIDSAAAALQKAVEYGTSGIDEAGRGSGLHDVLEAALGLGGEATIFSDQAILHAVSPARYRAFKTSNTFPGTVIRIEIGYHP